MSSAVQFIRKQVQLLCETEESWKCDHNAAMLCFETEEWVANLNFVFARILLIDERWRSDLFARHLPYDEELAKQIEDLLPQWKKGALLWLSHVDKLEADGFAVEGANELRQHLEDANSMLTPDKEFFTGDKLANLRDDAIAANRAGQTEELGLEAHH